MVDYILTNLFAATYGSGEYGAGPYNTGQTSTTTTTSSSTGLADTGVILVAVATSACLLIFGALFVRFAKRKRSHYVKNR